jgi:hypothetical protein
VAAGKVVDSAAEEKVEVRAEVVKAGDLVAVARAAVTAADLVGAVRAADLAAAVRAADWVEAVRAEAKAVD